MPIWPSSLTITPSLRRSTRPARRASSRLISVVLPAPRKPVMTTSGTRTPSSIALAALDDDYAALAGRGERNIVDDLDRELRPGQVSFCVRAHERHLALGKCVTAVWHH